MDVSAGRAHSPRSKRVPAKLTEKQILLRESCFSVDQLYTIIDDHSRGEKLALDHTKITQGCNTFDNTNLKEKGKQPSTKILKIISKYGNIQMITME